MSIFELRASIKEVNSKIEELNKGIMTSRDTLLLSESDKRKRKDQLDLDIRNQSEINKKQKEKAITKPYQDKLDDLQNLKIEREAEFKKDIASLSIDDYKEKFKDEINSKEDIEETYNKVVEISSNVISKRVIDVYLNAIPSEVKCDNLEDFEYKFNQLDSLVNKMSLSHTVDFHSVIDKVFLKMNPETFEDDNRKLLAYVAVYLVLIFIFRKYLFYGLLSVFCVFICLNIYKSVNVVQCLKYCKYAKDNIDKLAEYTEEGINSCIDSDKDMITEGYNLDIKDLESEMNKVQNNMKQDLEEFYKSYKFDSTDLVDQFNSAMSSKSREEDSLKNLIKSNQDKIDLLKEELSDLEQKLFSANKEIVNVYLNPSEYGKSYKFNAEYLIDKHNDEPVFFEHPKNSCVFIYQDYNLCKSLIYLMHLQNFNRTLPNNITEYVFDVKNLCKDFQVFVNKNISSEIICRTLPEVDDSVEDIHYTLLKRGDNINKEFQTIDEYNEFLNSIESITEGYIFLYSIGVYETVYKKEEFKQLLINGGDLGIYINLFVTQSELQNQFKEKGDYLNNISNYFVINKDNIRRLTDSELLGLKSSK